MEQSENYSINNPLIDSQHKKLVSLINELHIAMKDGKGKQVLQKILDDLVQYTKEHFSIEEMLKKNANYAGFSSHKAEQNNLTKKAVELQKSYKEV